MSEYIVDYELIPLKWRDGYGLSDVDLTEEIIRCRDCEYCVHSEAWPDALDCKRTGLPTDDDFFCAWGEWR